VQISLIDERSQREQHFFFEGGIVSFVRYLNRNRQNLHPSYSAKRNWKISGLRSPFNIPTLSPNRSTPLPTPSTPWTAAPT
jgi:hypothetical protein